jgi:hypothetical protein
MLSEGTLQRLRHEIDFCGRLQNLISTGYRYPYRTKFFWCVDGFKIFENCSLQQCYLKLC